MGDRANFGFRQSNGHTVYLYGHWAGWGMEARLAAALDKARPRWSDEAYATRICISQIIGERWDQELSWGIHVDQIGDNEHDVPVVDWEAGKVYVYEEEGYSGRLKATPRDTYDIDEYVTQQSQVTA